jgi:hypothetical protein
MAASSYGSDAWWPPTSRRSAFKAIDHRQGAQEQWDAIEDFDSPCPIDDGHAQRAATQPHQGITEYEERPIVHAGAFDFIETNDARHAETCRGGVPVGKIHCGQVV